MRITSCLALFCAAAALATAAELTINNESLQVRFDAAANILQVRSLSPARSFARDGSLRERGGKARVAQVSDKTFGGGQAIEVSYAGGGSDSILLFPKLPFVLFRSTLRNGGPAASVTDKVRPVAFTVDFGTPAGALNILGTGGLAPAAKAKGSYMWLAVAEPETRRGVVGGWITSERGSGVVLPEVQGERIRMNAQIDYGKLRLMPGQTETLETFALGWFDDARVGLELWADAVAKVYAIKLPPQPVGYCTWYHARASTETKLAEQTAFAKERLQPFGLSFIQIDDGWQDGLKKNGPKKNFTQIYDKGPYPSGMKKTADMIKSKGFVAGLWFMPFAGTVDDPWFKDRQDWFVKREDGKPYDVFWGGTSLDMTNPAAREYVRGIASRISKEWGYKYFKMDGLWTGSATEMQYVNDAYKDDHIGNALFHDKNKTNVDAYRDGLKLVRDAAGSDVFLLGCNTAQNMRVYGASFGLLDAMRIGPDNGPALKSLLRGPSFGTRNYHLHGRVWWNDPDPLYVRATMPLEHAQLISSWVTVSGQFSVSSDAYADLPPERLDILKRTMPSHGFQARPVDLFEREMPRVWFVKGNGRNVIGLFNWDASETAIEYPLERIGLARGAQYVAFDFWANKLAGPFRDKLSMRVGPTSSVVLAVRPVASHPQVISASRHIMQGMVDVTSEEWNGRELTGASKVVGGDPYELRIVRSGWKAAGVEAPAGVKASMKEDGGLVRVTLESPASQDVRWKIRFAR